MGRGKINPGWGLPHSHCLQPSSNCVRPHPQIMYLPPLCHCSSSCSNWPWQRSLSQPPLPPLLPAHAHDHTTPLPLSPLGPATGTLAPGGCTTLMLPRRRHGGRHPLTSMHPRIHPSWSPHSPPISPHTSPPPHLGRGMRILALGSHTFSMPPRRRHGGSHPLPPVHPQMCPPWSHSQPPPHMNPPHLGRGLWTLALGSHTTLMLPRRRLGGTPLWAGAAKGPHAIMLGHKNYNTVLI